MYGKRYLYHEYNSPLAPSLLNKTPDRFGRRPGSGGLPRGAVDHVRLGARDGEAGGRRKDEVLLCAMGTGYCAGGDTDTCGGAAGESLRLGGGGLRFLRFTLHRRRVFVRGGGWGRHFACARGTHG